MGLRTIFTVIKPLAPDQLKPWLAEAVAAMPGPERGPGYSAKPKDYCALHVRDTLVLTDDAWCLAESAAARQNLLHLELRAQEGDHWDFTLTRAGSIIADFSTCVKYFDERRNPPRPWKHGDLAAFASAWGVDPNVVGPYLIDWGLRRKPTRVRPTDRCETGDVYQLFDFMPLLGVSPPQGHPDRFAITAPTWTWSPSR
jgi:hypothetical protein